MTRVLTEMLTAEVAANVLARFGTKRLGLRSGVGLIGGGAREKRQRGRIGRRYGRSAGRWSEGRGGRNWVVWRPCGSVFHNDTLLSGGGAAAALFWGPAAERGVRSGGFQVPGDRTRQTPRFAGKTPGR
jgi:hypothetical protein